MPHIYMYVLHTARWSVLGMYTPLVRDQSWWQRASRQSAAVSLAQLQPNTTNTDTPHQYPEVHVWVTELESSPWPLTPVWPSHAEAFLPAVVLWDGIRYGYRYGAFNFRPQPFFKKLCLYCMLLICFPQHVLRGTKSPSGSSIRQRFFEWRDCYIFGPHANRRDVVGADGGHKKVQDLQHCQQWPNTTTDMKGIVTTTKVDILPNPTADTLFDMAQQQSNILYRL